MELHIECINDRHRGGWIGEVWKPTKGNKLHATMPKATRQEAEADAKAWVEWFNSQPKQRMVKTR